MQLARLPNVVRTPEASRRVSGAETMLDVSVHVYRPGLSYLDAPLEGVKGAASRQRSSGLTPDPFGRGGGGRGHQKQHINIIYL